MLQFLSRRVASSSATRQIPTRDSRTTLALAPLATRDRGCRRSWARSGDSAGRRSLDYQSGHTVRSAGVVVGSLIDPQTIANDHIRIHALEGQLFRGVVTDAAERRGVRCAVWRERDIWDEGIKTLKRPEKELRDIVSALGGNVEGPWRAEHRAATLAAWLVLARRPPAARH